MSSFNKLRIIWKSTYANSILKVDKIVSHILKKVCKICSEKNTMSILILAVSIR